RLAFGRAVLHSPLVLLLLDPLANCDANSSDLLIRLIRRSASEGSAVLILTDDAAGLAPLCRPTHLLERGHLRAALVAEQATQDDLPFKIPARHEGQINLVNPAQVLYVSAEEGRTCLHTADGAITTHLTLSELEARLVRHGFFRAHRSYLVNLQRVKMVVPYTRDSFSLILDDPDNTEVPLSKAAARDLREFLGY
ncbi:MAG TPA: LytTR family DNA-binding domain-containing protein, partial [Anaerolineae bacterium]|nr:LytTR family DNA-binding domain-containing protein [Anaerolineae bacterium]